MFAANGGPAAGALLADGTAIPSGTLAANRQAMPVLAGVCCPAAHRVVVVLRPAGSLAIVGSRFEAHRGGFPVVMLQQFSAAACPTVDRCSFANNSQPASLADQSGLLDVRGGCLFVTRSSFAGNRGWLGAMIASASFVPAPAAPIVLHRVAMANNTGRQCVALLALTAQPFIVGQCA